MSTGDIKNNLKKLQASLKLVKFEKDIDITSMSKGVATAYLPIYHYLFIDYSRHLAEKISELNIELQGKSDVRFIESVYKVLRELFTYKPPVTKDQFFSNSFGERKVIMTTEVATMIGKKHKSLAPKPKVKVNLAMNTTAPAGGNTSRLSASSYRPTTAPPHAAAAGGTTGRKPPPRTASKASSVVPKLVVSDVRDPKCIANRNQSNVSRVTISSSVCSSGSERNVDYNPGNYVNNSEGAVSIQNGLIYDPKERHSSVEIVSLNQQPSELGGNSEGFPEDSSILMMSSGVAINSNTVRPIDIVKTPGRPLVESHRFLARSGADASMDLHSSPIPPHHHQPISAVEGPGAIEEQLSRLFDERLTEIENRVIGIVNRVTVLEGQVNIQEQQQVITPQKLENLTARLTLIENRLLSVEHRPAPPSTGPVLLAGKGAYQPAVYESREAMSTGTGKQHTPERHNDSQHSSGHDSPDSDKDKENKKPDSEPNHPPKDPVFSDSLEVVSPIAPSAAPAPPHTDAASVSSESPVVGINAQVKTTQQHCSTPDNTITAAATEASGKVKFEQVDRIKNMMKDTEELLNIQSQSPLKPANN